MRSLTPAIVVSLMVAAPALGGTQTELNKKIVAFCAEHKGQQVGGGECSHLAEEALRVSGGQRRGPDAPNPGDYTWGKEVCCVERVGKKVNITGQIKSVQPGDIIQMRDAKWWSTDPGGQRLYKIAAHHTAVVAAVESNGKAIKVYEQNSNGRRTVGTGRIALSGLKEGWIRIYRPHAADGGLEDARSR